MYLRLLIAAIFIVSISPFISFQQAAATPLDLSRLSDLLGAEIRIENSKLTIGKIRKFSRPARCQWLTGAAVESATRFDRKTREESDRFTVMHDANAIVAAILKEVFDNSDPMVSFSLKMPPVKDNQFCSTVTRSEAFRMHVDAEFIELKTEADYRKAYGESKYGQQHAYCATYLSALTQAKFTPSGSALTITELAPESSLLGAGLKVGETINDFEGSMGGSGCSATDVIDKSINENMILQIGIVRGLKSNGCPKIDRVPVAFKSTSERGQFAERPIIAIGEPGFAEYRWSLLEEGNLKQLERVWEYDVTEISKLLHPSAYILNPNLRNEISESRYAGLFAQYALMKGAMIGLCGNPGKSYAHTTEIYKQVKNGFGTILREELTSRDVSKFEVEERFAEWVDLHGSNKVWHPYLQSIKDLLQGENCESSRLVKLEINMSLFYSKKF